MILFVRLAVRRPDREDRMKAWVIFPWWFERCDDYQKAAGRIIQRASSGSRSMGAIPHLRSNALVRNGVHEARKEDKPASEPVKWSVVSRDEICSTKLTMLRRSSASLIRVNARISARPWDVVKKSET